VKKRKATNIRYVGRGVPRSVPKGRVLNHNHVRHTIDMPCGVNGFRAFTSLEPLPNFKPCKCGWSGLPHYSRSPDYKCETWDDIQKAIAELS
jgi:hypothetical protein